MAGVTRTATCTARSGVDVTTGEVLTSAMLVDRVCWLAELIAEIGQGVVDAHWNPDDIRAISAKETPGGARVPSFAYKAVASLWGWSKPPTGVYAVSRVVWMGQELAGRQLRSAGYRLGVVDQLLAGALPQDCADPVSGENWRRRIGRHLNETGKLPAGLMDLEPTAPRVPALVPLAAVDKQFAELLPGKDNHTATIRLLLPTVARPASKNDWAHVEFTVNVPARYQRGLLRPATLRVSRDRKVVRVDLPVEFPAAPKRPDNGRVLGLDWGVRRALTGAAVHRLPGATRKSRPAVDGRPLFFSPASLLSKSRRLSGLREKARGRIDRYEQLLAGRPDPVLAAKKAVLEAEVARINARQSHLQDQIARLAARWAVEQALAANCNTIALEDLKTLEHRGLGKKTNVRVSLAMRGKIATAIEQAAELEGLRVVKVPARGTSSFCSRCDSKIRHLTAPNGKDGHAWAVCTACGHSADRDHLAAENVGCRALAPKAGRVRHKKTTKKHLAPRPKPARQRGLKTGPTPKRPTNKARRRAGRAVTPPPEATRGHRQAEPEPQGHHGQVRTTATYPVQDPLDGLRYAYRRRLKTTPVLYRRSPETPGVHKNA